VHNYKSILLVLQSVIFRKVSDKAIIVTDLHKRYDLGVINSGTFSDDLRKWWAKQRGHKDPTLPVDHDHSAKEYWALKGVDFEIKKGESVGIIGKNGAGKSTLLKILSRVTVPTKGSVKINGRIASLLEVGTGFHPDLTGRENIFMNGAILGMSRREIATKLDEIIAFSGVEKFVETPVKRYSSGMYVRLAFAVAAHLESEILIVDEVLAVGDAEFQKKCLGRMGEVSKEGRTVLFVSHNMGAIAELCYNSIVLSSGSLLYEGDVKDAISYYYKLNSSASQSSSSYIANPSTTSLKKYYISVVELKDSEENVKDAFLFEESIHVQTTIKSNAGSINTTLSLMMLSKNQNRVFTLHKEIVIDGDEAKINIKLPSSLFAPNYYSFSLCVLFHNREIYDLVESVCSIQIVDNGTEYAMLEGLDYGNVLIDAEWEIESRKPQ